MDSKCFLTSTDLQTRRARCHHQLSFLLFLRQFSRFLLGWGPIKKSHLRYNLLCVDGKVEPPPHTHTHTHSLSLSLSGPGLISSNHCGTLVTCTSVGFLGPGGCLIATGFIECNKMAAVAMIVIGVGLSGISMAGWAVNHLDLAPPYAGTPLLILGTSLSGLEKGLRTPQRDPGDILG